MAFCFRNSRLSLVSCSIIKLVVERRSCPRCSTRSGACSAAPSCATAAWLESTGACGLAAGSWRTARLEHHGLGVHPCFLFLATQPTSISGCSGSPRRPAARGAMQRQSVPHISLCLRCQTLGICPRAPHVGLTPLGESETTPPPPEASPPARTPPRRRLETLLPCRAVPPRAEMKRRGLRGPRTLRPANTSGSSSAMEAGRPGGVRDRASALVPRALLVRVETDGRSECPPSPLASPPMAFGASRCHSAPPRLLPRHLPRLPVLACPSWGGPLPWARLASSPSSSSSLLFGRKSESSNPPPSFAVVTELKPN